MLNFPCTVYDNNFHMNVLLECICVLFQNFIHIYIHADVHTEWVGVVDIYQ